MHEERIGAWLDQLASSEPAPGGGAAAALETGIAAGLVEMVCNLTIGKPAFAEHEAVLRQVRERAGARRAEALGLADEDAEAFTAVIAAYRLPKESDAEKAERSEQIQKALAAAADVPRRTAAAGAELVDLCDRIVDTSNPNVISDIAAAAAAARAALASSLVNIEINLGSITDQTLAADLHEHVRAVERDLERADAVVANVRRRIAAA